MPLKRSRSSSSSSSAAKKVRIQHPNDHLSSLSDELLIRILHSLPLPTLLRCHLLSHRFYILASDSQLWKSLYYSRFILPRVLQIPGIRNTMEREDALLFSSKQSKWLEQETLANRHDGKPTNWKGQYRLRHNWARGACEVQEIRVKDSPNAPEILVQLAEGVVVTVDREDGLRAWGLKEKELILQHELEGGIPTCLAIDEKTDGLGIAIGFVDGGWGAWTLDLGKRVLKSIYRHPASSCGMISAVAYTHPYVLSITESQVLSLYFFGPAPRMEEPLDSDIKETSRLEPLMEPYLPESAGSAMEPRLLASLRSHSSWPPLTLSLRTTPTTITASIVYSLPTYLSGFTIGLQELKIALQSGTIISSRLASALPPFTPLTLNSTSSSEIFHSQPAPLPTSSLDRTRPTSLSYKHPYILATYPDNTLTLYLCTSTTHGLSLSSGSKLWGHTSRVASAAITRRGKAVSVCGRGEEVRVWELEGRFSASTTAPTHEPLNFLHKRRKKSSMLAAHSVVVRPDSASSVVPEGRGSSGDQQQQVGTRRWVGFDEEVVIVLKEIEDSDGNHVGGTQALVIYDFT